MVTSPLELRRALTKSQPKLEIAYLQCRDQPQPPYVANEVDSIISWYPAMVTSVFAVLQEVDAKELITPSSLRELGIKQQGDVLEQFGPAHRPFSIAEIMRRRERYVVLMRDGNLQGVIDRVELASRIAVGEP